MHFGGKSNLSPLGYMVQNTVISFPIPPYSNVPIQPQYYQPRRFVISAITLGVQTTVTTSVNHNYVIGQEVRLLIPIGYGSRGLSGQSGYVISIPAPNQVLLTINSVGIDQFISASLAQSPQIIAVGDINTGIISSTGMVLPIGQVPGIPGSFENISP